ncbi:MAG: molybdopterin-synthase adenylyltransferase MoeB [Williamsia sp.]|nr:molybdopterin-synthase adenylyltransferase MoeB [Williamsia sp.]
MHDIQTFLSKLQSSIDEVSVLHAYKKLQAGSLLIDIREKDEVSGGSPAGAIRIPKGMLEMKIGQVATDPAQEVYLLCASGKRSLVAAFCLQQMGYENVYSVEGGFGEWKNRALPFEMPRTLKEADYERYKRHLLIPELGEAGQIKLLSSRVLVVGAGGIGSPVALYLAAAGIGTIGLIDDDIVDRSNLQRQILHTEQSVGSPKVDSAKQRLSALNPAIRIVPIQTRLDADNIETILQDYDLVLDGTDNFTTRYLINDACVKLGKPNVHGSVFRFEGQVSTFWPASGKGNAPCYRCVYPTPPPAELAPSCAEAGVLGVLPGLVGVICATEAIKILAGFGNLLTGKLLCINAATWSFDTYEIDQEPSCPYCGCTDPAHYPPYAHFEQSCSM